MYKNSNLSIGRLIPLLVALAALSDVTLRCLPLAWFSIRLEEPSRRYTIGLTDLTPGFDYSKARAYGDLANLTADSRLRFYRREWMRVDGNGFRQDGTPITPGQPPATVLFGDSFAMGVALSDDGTLAAQYSHLPGRTMVDPSLRLDWGRVQRSVDYLGMKRGTVVAAFLDRLPLPGVEDFGNPPSPDTTWDRWEHRRRKLWDGFWMASPLKILSERLIRHFQDGWLLPNPVGDRVVVRALRDGRPMIFFNQDIDNFGTRPDVNIAGLRLLQDRLRRHGLDLFVLLVPDKYAVYHRLLQNPPPEPSGPSRIAFYESALRQSGIRVLNLEPAFLRGAEEALKKGELIYWLDDTHWNPAGTRLAATTLAEALP